MISYSRRSPAFPEIPMPACLGYKTVGRKYPRTFYDTVIDTFFDPVDGTARISYRCESGIKEIPCVSDSVNRQFIKSSVSEHQMNMAVNESRDHRFTAGIDNSFKIPFGDVFFRDLENMIVFYHNGYIFAVAVIKSVKHIGMGYRYHVYPPNSLSSGYVISDIFE